MQAGRGTGRNAFRKSDINLSLLSAVLQAAWRRGGKRRRQNNRDRDNKTDKLGAADKYIIYEENT